MCIFSVFEVGIFIEVAFLVGVAVGGAAIGLFGLCEVAFFVVFKVSGACCAVYNLG